MNYLGNFTEDAIIYLMFNTFSSDDPSASCTITDFLNTDVHIHKDDGLTQRNNAAGITVSIDFDGITGSHMIKIDTSDNTVAGFWVTGSDYFVRIEGTTVDGATINAVVGHFSIENRNNQVDVTHLLGHLLTQTGTQLADGFEKFFNVDAPIGTINSLPGAAPDAVGGLPISDAGGLDLDTKLANTNEITAERMGALTDWINGGRLDLLLDAIPTTAMRGTDGAYTGTPPTAEEIADQIWDEILTGATHNIPTSAGRRLREIAAFAIHSGTAQAGNSHSITLSADADANSGIYNRNLLVLVGGTGIGQTRTIVDYDGASKVVVIDRDWRISPNNTTEYQIVPDDTPLTVDHGKVQAATESTITIREYASDKDNAYLCNIVAIITGKGRGQARLVGAYNGTTKVVTLCGDNWIETPDVTSVYALIPYGVSCTSCFNTNAKTQIKSEVDDALIDYDPPTRAEAAEDREEILTEVIAGLAALNDITVLEIIAGISDGTFDLQAMTRLIFAACCGKSSGGGTPINRFRDSADNKNRIEAHVDSNGNRTGVILDGE